MRGFYRIGLLLSLLLLPVACQAEDAGGGVTVTAPTAATEAATAAPLAPSATVAAETAPPTTAPSTQTPTAPATASEPAGEASVSPTPAEATSAPVTSIQLAPVAAGFSAPTYLAHAADERLFVVEQPGRIRLVEGSAPRPEPFLDIEDRVGSQGSEQGLLSVAFHPQHAENGYFYVNYTNRSGDTVIARYQVGEDATAADRASEQILLTIGQPYRNHNGGQLQFGPDGYLYVGMGDGGSAGDPQNNGQDPTTLLGTLLRLDVDGGGEAGYAIPPDNPFAGNDGGRREIWAIGLRNPWRFSFDRLTGDLYVADVGQNEYEEVNFVPAGLAPPLNYGWNVMEGDRCFRSRSCDREGFYPPQVVYSHAEGGCSVTGGYVYRGEQFPALRGNYFYGDFCSGKVWGVPLPDGEARLVGTAPGNITSFGEDAAGELYLLTQQGQIYQIQP